MTDIFAAADAATCWVVRRYYVRVPGALDVRFGFNHGVMLPNGLIVTTAHALAGEALHMGWEARAATCGMPVGWQAMAGRRKMPVGQAPEVMLISVFTNALDLGSDPEVTVAIERPPLAPTPMPAGPEIKKRGLRILQDRSEFRAHPIFCEPYSDVALLGEHEGKRGSLDGIRDALRPMPVRRRMLERGEKLHMRSGEHGWLTAVVEASSLTPNAVLRVEGTKAFSPGDCGLPIIDQCGELVGVVAYAPKVAHDRGALVAQLFASLPAWVFA